MSLKVNTEVGYSTWYKSRVNRTSLAEKAGVSAVGILITVACTAYLFAMFFFHDSMIMQHFTIGLPYVITIAAVGGACTFLPWFSRDFRLLFYKKN